MTNESKALMRKALEEVCSASALPPFLWGDDTFRKKQRKGRWEIFLEKRGIARRGGSFLDAWG